MKLNEQEELCIFYLGKNELEDDISFVPLHFQLAKAKMVQHLTPCVTGHIEDTVHAFPVVLGWHNGHKVSDAAMGNKEEELHMFFLDKNELEDDICTCP